MLVLSRHKDERIIIGNRFITVAVADIRGDKVRLAIDAPRELAIHREEVFEAIEREKQGQDQDTDEGSHDAA